MSLFDFDTGPVPPMAVSCNQFASYQFPQELRVFYSSFDLLLLRLVPVRSRQFIFDACVSQYTTRSKQQKHVDAIPGGTIMEREEREMP